MKRRTFIKGAVAAAVAASIPGPEYTYKTFRVAREWTHDGKTYTTLMAPEHQMSQRMANALARSMMQTKEIVARNVLNRAFGE